MNSIGICPHSHNVYEGSPAGNATRIFPAPLLIPIRFLGPDGLPAIDNHEGYSAEIFREEFFDPITKVRRGRVFTRRYQNSYQLDWRVQDPWRTDLPTERWAGGTAQKVNLLTWSTDNLQDLRKPENKRHRPKVVLGWEEHCTFWQIVSVETPIRSGPVLTLKALFSLGDLPELSEEAIPEPICAELLKRWDALDGTLNRFSAIEVIDRCRDLLAVVFGHLSGDETRDLSKSVGAYMAGKKAEGPERKGEDMLTWSAGIVARLHARGKPSEQKRLNLRPPTDSDAQLALRCVGFILLDLGWAQ